MAPDARLLEKAASFSTFSNILDSRLLRALADMGFARPTLIQARTIPLALDEHRDILARARTGSGKTAAYCIPIVQKILLSKGKGKDKRVDGVDADKLPRGLILVPTRELAEQVATFLRSVVRYCEKDVIVINITSGTTTHLQRTLLSDYPDVVVATPSRALSLLQSKTLFLSAIDSLVIDEADLILSYGHDNDVRQIFSGGYLSKVHQSFLMSATMTEDVDVLKGLLLRNPAILKLEEAEDEAASLSQYVVRCSEVDKFLLIYVILKLKLVNGKCILFVNDVERCYRLKLFLEQFSIKSCVLNSELPLNSRYHTVQEFNKGVYDYIIATDEGGVEENDKEEEAEVEEGELTPTQWEDPVQDTPEDNVGEGEHAESEARSDLTDEQHKRKRLSSPSLSRKRQKQQSEGQQSKPSKKSRGKHKSDKEYGVTRGIDFVDVACVFNFDCPTSARSYTHRVGRTARAGRTGMSLSFVVPREEWGKNKVVGCLPSAQNDERIFKRIEKQQGARGSQIKEYKFDMRQVEAFRYRMEDALRSVTKAAIKEAWIKELKSELLNSDKLKAYFEDNPLDLEHLRHDKALRPARVQPHLKHIPKYLLPKMAPVQEGEEMRPVSGAKPRFVPFRKDGAKKGRSGRGGKPSLRGKKKSDPLKKFR